MPTNHLTRLNGARKAIRSRMGRDAKAYAATSAKMLKEMEKLSKDNLAVFLKKNPDVLMDITAGTVAKLGAKVRTAAISTLRDFKNEWNSKRALGKGRIRSLAEELEDRGLQYLKKLLSV